MRVEFISSNGSWNGQVGSVWLNNVAQITANEALNRGETAHAHHETRSSGAVTSRTTSIRRPA